ncbi:MucBP domain-containing protein [Lentilactobacillus kribbianus]|uniref:MucBP domain-containing protein n=1 Tax=Lentilactobacillus kribbianus TaxID=2729622 RepID=UPI0015529D09|nr:MucBP domain-containing protein [Lentilactobacillus kribbianus]
MGLISWITDRFKKAAKTPTQSTKQPATDQSTNQSLNHDKSLTQHKSDSLTSKRPSSDQELALTVTNTSVELNIPKTTITYFFLDEHDQPIRTPDWLVGVVGTAVNYSVPEIDNYYFTGVDQLFSTFPQSNESVTIHYERLTGSPVQIYYLDYDTTNTLHPMSLITGMINEEYQITPPDIADYRILQSIGNQRGLLTTQTQQVIYYYRKTEWRTVQSVDYYVKLTADAIIYDNPDGNSLRHQLPKGLILRVFTEIKTNNNELWLNIGGDQWLLKNKKISITEPGFNHWISDLKLNRTKIRLTSKVDCRPALTTPVYDAPYGMVVGYLTNRTTLNIIEKCVDDQNVIWYRLDNNHYIPATFTAK